MSISVLHLIPSLSGGGAEKQLSVLLPAVSKLGINASLGFVNGGPNLDRIQSAIDQLFRVNAAGNYDMRRYTGVSRLIRKLNPDIVQTWLPQMDIIGGFAALRRGVPFVISERSSAALYQPGLKTTLRLRIGARAAAIVANSAGGSEYWRDRLEPRKLLVIPNGIEVPNSARPGSSADDAIASPRSEQVLLFAGRYVESKNVTQTMNLFSSILKRRDNAVARFFGGGDLQDRLLDIASRASLGSRLQVNGYCDNLVSQFQNASVLVSLSAYEGHPNVVLEAAANACPLVLSNIAAHREIFDDESAWFVDSDNSADIEATVLRVLDSPQVSAEKAARALSIVREFSVDSAARQYAELYRDIADRSTQVC